MGSLLPVLANPTTAKVVENGVPLARGKYIHNTSTLQVNDLLSGDSRGAYLEFIIPGKTYSCNDTSGGGTPPARCNITVPRGVYFELKLCAIDAPPYHQPSRKPTLCASAYGRT
jgi:hypothetical protein